MKINLQQVLTTIRSKCHHQGVDCLISRNPNHVRYLTGCTVQSAGDTFVLISPTGMTLFTDTRYEAGFRRAVADNPLISLVILSPKTVWEDLLQPAEDGQRVGFEKPSTLTPYFVVDKLQEVAAKRNITLVGIEDIIMSLRMIKTQDEIALMKKAFGLSDKAFRYILKRLRVGRTELDIARELNAYMRKLSGSDEISFATIVASGENGDVPHATVTDRALRKGDLITIDFGLVYQGYHTDTTRTVALGEPDERLRQIYNVVLQAQLATVNGVKVGMTGVDADKIARDIITAAGYEKEFGHGTGHGVGLDEHELPRLTYTEPGNNLLSENSVFSIEPGIYIYGVGGVRIEDVGVLTKDGFRPFTRLSKELTVL